MTQISVFSVSNYLGECFRLLFWAYFKPYTFAKWLREIHPELKPHDNPFIFRRCFNTNPQLRRYAWQVLILTSVFPLPIISIAHYLAKGTSSFLPISIFSGILVWLIGLYLAVKNNEKRFKWFQQLTWLLVVIPFGSHHSSSAIKIHWLLTQYIWLPLCALAIALNLQWGMGQSFGIAVSWLLPLFVGSRMNLGMMWLLVCLLAPSQGLIWAPLTVFLGIPLVISLLEFLSTVLIYILSRRGSKVQWLAYLPPRFNERILSPLPFMTEIIVEAHNENPTAARETINYLLTYTNQQKIATQAIKRIAKNSLQKCRTLEEIADITSVLNWISTPMPKPFGLVLPQLLDVSQDVQASINATSTYRKYKSLDKPISNLHSLLRDLANSKDANLAKTFGSITQHWLNILETAQPNLKQLSLFSAEIRQVYIAGNALEPETAKERFKGRNKIFREIEKLALAEQPPVLFLYGRRRTGKTSALKYLPNRVAANLVPLLVDFQGAAIATTLPGLAEQIAKQIIEAARRLPRRLDFPDPGAMFRVATDPFIVLENWFAEIERTFPDKRFLLCLDEFPRLDEFVEATKSRVPLNFLRSIIQHRQQWILLFSGSCLPQELAPYWSDYLINSISIQLDYLQESEARELIERPVEDFSKNIYEPDAVDAIIQLTRCQPYLVQLVCYQVVELLNHYIRTENRPPEFDTTATVEDVEKSIDKVLEGGYQYFQELWNTLRPEEQNLLLRLVNHQPLTPLDNKLVRKLIKKDILQPIGECPNSLLYQNVSFQVPLVQKFIEQEIDPW